MSDTGSPRVDLANDRNPYAFPAHGPDDEFNGMTLRDWFAGQALAGLLAGQWNVEVDATESQTLFENREPLAQNAYLLADAMLAERAKS